MKIIASEDCTGYRVPSHPERPERVGRTMETLRAQSEIVLEWVEPGMPEESSLLRVHSPEHLARLREPRDFDSDTPFFFGVDQFARASAGSALDALKWALAGHTAFSLMRPPGHHALRSRAMGFCYLNNIAIAALEALELGVERMAIFDFDVHHGNGTEAILLNRPGTAFFSVHQFPCYPGTGTRNLGSNCYNYPIVPQAPRWEYRQVLEDALEQLRAFKPDCIGVSAGFDCYARDPLAQGSLEMEDFYWLGQSFRNIGVPLFSVLEGGYSDDLPDLVFAFLKGLEEHKTI